MAQQNQRTKQRTQGSPWNSISKLAGFRWYVNNLENLLLSIYAEHPDLEGDPARVAKERVMYKEIWDTLAACDAKLKEIKMKYAPPKPQACTSEGGCWDDNDCFDDWVCIKGFCRPPNHDDTDSEETRTPAV